MGEKVFYREYGDKARVRFWYLRLRCSDNVVGFRFGVVFSCWIGSSLRVGVVFFYRCV